jgi:hypothetical protein
LKVTREDEETTPKIKMLDDLAMNKVRYAGKPLPLRRYYLPSKDSEVE